MLLYYNPKAPFKKLAGGIICNRIFPQISSRYDSRTFLGKIVCSHPCTFLFFLHFLSSFAHF